MLSSRNTRTFQRTLYGGIGMLKKIQLLKRNDDQQQGTVRAVTIWRARRSSIQRTGETIQGSMTADSRCVWHLPKIDLEQAGVNYVNALDRFVEDKDDLGRDLDPPRYWQPEADTLIEHKLFENEICVACLRVDPPEE